MSTEKITVKELRKLAARYRIKGRSRMNKARLLDALKPFMDTKVQPQEPERSTPEPETKPSTPPKKPMETAKNPVEAEMESLGELPFSYDEDVIELLPKNPEELYAFWDLSTSTWERVAAQGTMVIRLEIPGVKVVQETMVDASVREYYFRIPDQRGPYRVSLHLADGRENPVVLLQSEPVKAPPNHPGPGSLRFAKVPFDVPLPVLKHQGGLLAPGRTEVPRGPFILGDNDDTPYTRRFR